MEDEVDYRNALAYIKKAPFLVTLIFFSIYPSIDLSNHLSSYLSLVGWADPDHQPWLGLLQDGDRRPRHRVQRHLQVQESGAYTEKIVKGRDLRKGGEGRGRELMLNAISSGRGHVLCQDRGLENSCWYAFLQHARTFCQERAQDI